ncbi:MAG: hypothetical protein WCL32_16175 [Planctomycetota bacterium]
MPDWIEVRHSAFLLNCIAYLEILATEVNWPHNAQNPYKQMDTRSHSFRIWGAGLLGGDATAVASMEWNSR